MNVEELDFYGESGYVVISDVFTKDELSAIDQEIDRICEQDEGGNHRNAGWVMSLGLRSEITKAFVQDARILALIEDIVKPGIAIYSGKLTTKMPYSEDICHWHQDDAYYNAHATSQTRLSVWTPLQDAKEENGCLWVVPGSHKGGVVAHGSYGGQCPRSMGPADLEVDGAISCPVKAGDMLLFSAELWHHSRQNQTGQIRRAFIVSYQEATVPRGNGDQWKILRR
jgi:ectoine hydroxylase-related dioxygenase (phytanoyl-CoA dioxygenase family)